MRLFFAGFLMTGLFLIGYGVHERRAAAARGDVVAPLVTCEDGTGFPYPYPTPRPTPKIVK
jgi:hypothetical protein